jgi:hypothetical protein
MRWETVSNVPTAIWTQQPQPAREATSASESSWAQAMGGSRPTNQLDLSASSFPSLNNSGQQSQNFNAGSAWQTGPPQSETRRNPIQPIRPQGSRQANAPAADAFYPTDSFSRSAQNEFPIAEPSRRTSTAPSGPPGLQRPGQVDGISGDPSRVTSPSGLPQDCKSDVCSMCTY